MHSSGCSCHTQWHSIKSKDNIQGFYQQRWRFQQSHSSISLLGHVNGSIQEPNRFISIQYSAGIPIYSVNNPHTQINCFIHRTWTATFVTESGYSGQIMLTWRDITNVLLNVTPTKWTSKKINRSSIKSGFIKQRLILGLKIERLSRKKHVRWLTHPCLQGQVWPRLGHSRVHVADPHPCLVAEVAEVSLNIGDAPIGKSWIHQWITGLWYTYPSEK